MLRSILEILLRVKGGTQTKAELGKAQKSVNALTGAASQLGLALGLAGVTGALVIFGKQSFKMAGQAERLGKATDNLAQSIGTSGDAMVKSIQDASKGMVNQVDAMTAANKAMLFGIVENEDQMKELTTIAIVLGQAMGRDAAASVDDLTTALGRQSPMILDNLGITLKLEEAYAIYARELGKTAEELTEVERKQAFANAALEKGRERVEQLGGEVVVDKLGQIEALTAAWADFQAEFGSFLVAGGVIETLTKVAVALKEGAQAWQDAIARREAVGEVAKAQRLAAWSTAAAVLTPKFIRPEEMKDIGDLASHFAQALQRYSWATLEAEKLTDQLDEMSQAEEEAAIATKENTAAQTDSAEAQKAAGEAAKARADAVGAYSDYAKEAARLEKDYAQQRQDTVDEYGKRRVEMEQSYASQREQALEDFTKQQGRQLRDYRRQEQQAEQTYYDRRQDSAEAFGEQIAQMEADHQKKMGRMREDYDMRQEDAVGNRDALAFLRNQRQYEVQRRRAEEDYGDAASQRSTEYGRQLADQEEQFVRQREQRQAGFELRREDQQVDFDQRREREAEQHQEMMVQYDQDHQDRLTDMQTAFADEKSARDDAFADELADQGVWLGSWSRQWREGEAQLEEDYAAHLQRMRNIATGGTSISQAAGMVGSGGVTGGSFVNSPSFTVNEATTPPAALVAMIQAQINDSLVLYGRGR